jgi:serine/threonine protein kinase
MIKWSKHAPVLALFKSERRPQPPPSPRPLKQINDYLLRAKIGAGSSSMVFLGTDVRTGEDYAIKRIRLQELRNGDAIMNLEREIRLMRLFQHPNILKLFKVLHDASSDEVYLVLEHAAVGSLGAFIERGQRLSVPSTLSVIKQISRAIKFLHENCYVHQDIKPGNILLDQTGRAILADFGIGHSFTSASMVVGSPAYQAPEALDDSYVDADESASPDAPQKEDIWALGITLYQLLFGRLPYEGENLYQVVQAAKDRPIQIPDGTDPQVVRLLEGMLKLDPAERFLVDDVLDSPAIRGAPELATDLPEVPLVKMRDGETVKVEIDVCPEGFSFARLGRRRTLALGAGERSKSDEMIATVSRNLSRWGCDRSSRRSLET